MGTMVIVSLVIYALFETLINLFLQGSVWISKQIMNDSITIFSADENMLDSFYRLLPIGFTATDGTEKVIDLAGIIEGIGVAILVLIIVSSVLKSMAAPITGEETESPVQVGVRAVVAIFLKFLIFGSSLFSFNGLLGAIGRIFTIAMSYVGEKIKYPELTLGDQVLTNPVAYIGLILLTAALITAVLGAAITYIERILTFVASLLIGPIAVFFYANRSTSDITRSWIQSIFAQLGAILLSLVMWALFVAQLGIALAGDGQFLDLSGEATGVKIFQLAVAIAILSLVRNSEKIFNNIGIRTMPNADSARAILGGVGAIAGGIGLVRAAAPAAQRAVQKVLHNDKSGILSKNSSTNTNTKATPGGPLYNKDGTISTSGTGNKASRFAANMNQMGVNAPLVGKNSVLSMQKNQGAAAQHMASEIKKGEVGTAISGLEGKNGAIYSSAQTANMAISGKADGNGRFSFVSSQNANQNINVAKEGGIANVTSGGSMSIGETSRNAAAPDSSIRIAQTSAIDSSSVRGFAGEAVFSSNGVDTARGEYFVPTENGLSELAVGQSIDLGDGVERQITGGKVAIDDYGAYAYEIKPVDDIDSEIRSNINAVVQIDKNDIPIKKDEPIFEEVFGEANKDNGEDIDPN